MSPAVPTEDTMLISGVDYHDGVLWRLYVNNRWMWKYILVDRDTAATAWRALSTVDKLSIPAPANVEIHQVPLEDRWNDGDGEKAAYERLKAGLGG
ncbi:hypothetical protein SEA_RASPUTIA_112 [Microbacterium phage Rasputia]|nr:hypothetical protein SEA_RASPUTIA_112 [Microbacterium phage Rasputia]